MKTIILTLILILTASHSFAQLQLTSANNPVAGDVDRYTICDTTNITQGNSGINQNWSFLNLIRQDSTSVSFVAAGSTPYAAQFPTSNIASTNDNSSYNYMTTTASNMLINGSGSSQLIINNSNPQLYLQYPFSYGSNFTDIFSANYTISGSAVFRTGTTTVSADAWGTINLPSGSFPNSLRVKYVIVTRDSSDIGGTPFVSTTNLTSYVWFIQGKKFPVFEIIYTNFTANGFPLSSSKVVNYGDNVTIGITNISTETPDKFTLSQNYPNPFNPVTNLEFAISKSGFVSLKIYDMLGKEIADLVNTNLSPGTYKYNFDASGFASGIYFYTLKANEFNETKKMLLVK